MARPEPACRWPAILAVLAVAATLVAAVPGVASAHAVGLSRGTYVVRERAVSAVVTLARVDAATFASPTALADAVRVSSAGAPCPVTSARFVDAPPDGTSLLALYTCPAEGSRVAIDAAFVEDLPFGHRHVVHGESGPAGAAGVDDVLTRDHHAFEVHAAGADGGASPGVVDVVGASAREASSGAAFERAASFLWMGVEHILTGYDHLVFLFGLVLLGGRGPRAIVLVITAFTVAHSITLALATLGVWAPSPRIVEPAIALSIAYVGAENFFVGHGRAALEDQFPFGLIHGFGFAGALREIPHGRECSGGARPSSTSGSRRGSSRSSWPSCPSSSSCAGRGGFRRPASSRSTGAWRAWVWRGPSSASSEAHRDPIEGAPRSGRRRRRRPREHPTVARHAPSRGALAAQRWSAQKPVHSGWVVSTDPGERRPPEDRRRRHMPPRRRADGRSVRRTSAPPRGSAGLRRTRARSGSSRRRRAGRARSLHTRGGLRDSRTDPVASLEGAVDRGRARRRGGGVDTHRAGAHRGGERARAEAGERDAGRRPLARGETLARPVLERSADARRGRIGIACHDGIDGLRVVAHDAPRVGRGGHGCGADSPRLQPPTKTTATITVAIGREGFMTMLLLTRTTRYAARQSRARKEIAIMRRTSSDMAWPTRAPLAALAAAACGRAAWP